MKSWQDKIDLEILETEYKNIIWKDWQQELIDITKTTADDRKIYWVVDRKGNTGKTFLCKYLILTRKDCMILDPEYNIYNQIYNRIDSRKDFNIVLLDIFRSHKKNIDYLSLEKIKDGFLYCGGTGKHKCKRAYFESPHLFVFSTFEPDLKYYSHDRLHIIDLNK